MSCAGNRRRLALLSGNGYGGNFSVSDLIRLNLLKSTTTNLLKSATGILYHNIDTYTTATTDAINYCHNCIGRNIDEELAGSSTREIAAATQNPTAIIP